MVVRCKFIDNQVALNRTIFNDSKIVSRITFCNMMNPHNGKGCLCLLDNYTGETPIDWHALLEKRQKIRNDMINDIVPDACVGCYRLESAEPESHHKIKLLQIAAWEICNSKCVYCESDYIKNENKYIKEKGYDFVHKKFVEHYDVCQTLKDLMDKEILSKDARVDITGGEPTLYPKFNTLLSMLVNYGIKNIRIHTNAILYSPAIMYALEKNCATMVISIDAGTKKVHEKIKGVKSYDIVWQNVTKYAKIINSTENVNNHEMDLKYIIVEGLNDNKKEIKLFLKKAKETNSSCVSFNLRDQFNRKIDLDVRLANKLLSLTEYAIKESKKMKLKVYLHPNLKDTYLRLNKEVPIE